MAELKDRTKAEEFTLAFDEGPNSDGIGEWILLPVKLSIGLYFSPDAVGVGRVEFSMAPPDQIVVDDPTTGDGFSWDAGDIDAPYSTVVHSVISAFRLVAESGDIKVFANPRFL